MDFKINAKMKLSDLDFRPHVTREIFIGVLNPDDGVVVPVEEWGKREDQARAQFVVVIDKTQRLGLIINKTNDKCRESFGNAQFIAGLTMIDSPDVPPVCFGCPSRFDCMLIYDAMCAGLDNILELIGGEKLSSSWIWTCESDPEAEFTLIGAFVFDVEHGYIFTYDKNKVFDVRSVAPFNLKPL